jgi:hypothetical protein
MVGDDGMRSEVSWQDVVATLALKEGCRGMRISHVAQGHPLEFLRQMPASFFDLTVQDHADTT